ncbi:MAG: hypothetical protein V3T08_10260 [Gemmatimonadota bacterium]
MAKATAKSRLEQDSQVPPIAPQLAELEEEISTLEQEPRVSRRAVDDCMGRVRAVPCGRPGQPEMVVQDNLIARLHVLQWGGP